MECEKPCDPEVPVLVHWTWGFGSLLTQDLYMLRHRVEAGCNKFNFSSALENVPERSLLLSRYVFSSDFVVKCCVAVNFLPLHPAYLYIFIPKLL